MVTENTQHKAGHGNMRHGRMGEGDSPAAHKLLSWLAT